MRRILTEYFSWAFKLTGGKLFSYISGLILLTFGNFVIVKGLAELLKDWLSIVGFVLILFRFPIYFVTIVLFFGLAFWLTPPVQTVAKDAKKNSSYLTALLYIGFVAILLAYMQFGDTFFV